MKKITLALVALTMTAAPAFAFGSPFRGNPSLVCYPVFGGLFKICPAR